MAKILADYFREKYGRFLSTMTPDDVKHLVKKQVFNCWNSREDIDLGDLIAAIPEAAQLVCASLA